MTKHLSINFRNLDQVILYECELKGQISDGYWEKASPSGHWKPMCDADAISTSKKPLGPNFSPYRSYNFAAGALVNIVGTRMLWFVKIYNTFPRLSFDDHWTVDIRDYKKGIGYYSDNVLKWMKSKDVYWRDKAFNLFKLLKTNEEHWVETFNQIVSYSYDMKELKRDLKDMSTIVNFP